MTDTRSPDEIEREIETERAELRGTLNDLQSSLSPDAIVSAVTDQFRNHGGEIARNVGNAAKANPLALALTGIGLAWLMASDNRPPPPIKYRVGDDETSGRGGSSSWDDDGFDSGSRHAAVGRTDAGSLPPRSAVPRGPMPEWVVEDDDPSFEERNREASEQIVARVSVIEREERDGTYGAYDDDDDGSSGPSMGERAASARDGIADRAASARDGVSSRARGARDRASGAYSRARYEARYRSAAARQRAAEIRARLSKGTEDMSSAARERVLAARERAYEAQQAAQRTAREGADRAVDFYEEYPLVAGALALAVGAAVAGALPRTRTEDEYMGEQSDTLMAEANRVYREERDKVGRVAGAAADEARAVASELQTDAQKAARQAKDRADQDSAGEGTAADAVADRVEGAASRVAGAARSKAEEENLGGSAKKADDDDFGHP